MAMLTKKIVVLDGNTLNPGDLSWDELEKLGSCEVYERTSLEQVVERAKDADIVLTNKTILNRAAIEQLPKLRYIGVLATGYNVVDVEAASEKGITVTNVPAYGTKSVAQMVFAHVLELASHVGEHSRSVHESDWVSAKDFCYWNCPLLELSDLKMGNIGYGKIGEATALLARAFGMQVLVYNRSPKTSEDSSIQFVDLDTVFSECDVISLHCPLTDATDKMINKKRLNQMKSSAFLINTGRGPLIDEAALAEALDEGVIAGAGLDVLSSEPPSADNPLLQAKNCIITPHIAWATKAARSRLLSVVERNIQAFLLEKPQNIVSG
ncbi:MAG: D-2-hydroxyacid dehydrogenase [Opitutaceae bacterium]|nr:D-2-hydroxyacid dehydrogenase [Opitutaceae bacterium]